MGLSSDVSGLMQMLGGNFAIGSPAGPANVGRASQLAAFGDFTGGGLPQAAYLSNANVPYITVSSLTGSKQYTVGPNINGLIAADFNRDGKLDLAVAYLGNFSNTPGGVAVLLNNGDGTFAAVTYSAGQSPTSLAALDLNHDGILDLAVADNGGTVYVMLGKGDGTFGPTKAFSLGFAAVSVTIADFNRDGNPDLAVVGGQLSISILLGDGTGGFRAGPAISTGGPYRTLSYVAAGDLNRDGILDLATVDTNDNLISIYLGNGDGSFQLRSRYVTSPNPSSLIIADYNGDGIPDIIQGTGDARIFGPGVNNGTADFLIGNGDGTFQATPLIDAGTPQLTFMVTANFTGHGRPDVLVGGGDGNVFLLANTGSGTFQSPVMAASLPNERVSAAAADFNGDGKPDVAVGGLQLAVLLNNGNGTFQAPQTVSTGGATAIAAADLNGDGRQDLAVTNQSGVTIWFGNGNGTFQAGQTYSTGLAPGSLAVADLNGDNKPDIVVIDGGSLGSGPGTVVNGAVYVLLNNGNGTFASPQKYSVAGLPTPVAVADINGDGKADVIAGYQDASLNGDYHLAVFLNAGNGTLGAPSAVATDFGPLSIAVGDFNGDGKTDLVVAHCCGATDMTYLQGSGNGTFLPEVHFNAAASPEIVIAADLKGTHKLDLLVAGSAGLTALFNTSAAGAPVTAVSTSPNFGTGSGSNFTFNFTDSSGWQNLQVVDILINNALDGRHACYIAFVPGTNSVYLVDDAGDAGGPYQGMVLPASGSISNSQCTISGAGSLATGSGNNLTLLLNITFKSAFSGNKIFYLSAQDSTSGTNSGWQALGTWGVPGAVVTGPSVTSMSPAYTNSLGPTTYSFTYADTNGISDLAVLNILVNSAIDGRHACYLAFVPPTGQLFLVDDAGDAAGPFAGGATFPNPAAITNSQCTAGGAGSAVSINGNSLTLTLPITLTQSFAGNQLFFLAARSNSVSSNWQPMGSVAVP
jgi:hypothetical protein